MTTIRILFIGLSLSLLFTSCGAKKSVGSTPKTSPDTKLPDVKSDTEVQTSKTKDVVTNTTSIKSVTTLQYIETYSDIAVAQMREHKIPASITIAQGILESNSGNSSLTQKSNNHFGIKCHKSWSGDRTYYDDDVKGECFRVYKDPQNSYNDHSRFLKDRKRYADLFELDQRDYKAWAYGLSKAGYATDVRYPQKLINLITKFELFKYDEIVLGKINEIIIINSDFYIVQKGDGLYGISKRFGLSVDELKALNGLDNDTIYPGQKLNTKPIENKVTKVVVTIPKDTIQPVKLVDSIKPKEIVDSLEPIKVIDVIKQEEVEDSLKPKEDIGTIKPEEVAEEPERYIVQLGETLYQIAYKFKLEIPDLRRWNNIRKDEIKIGQSLWIKDPKTSANTNISSNVHIVIKDDTLYSIATKNGISVARLKTLNKLDSNTISIGQVLIIK